MSVSCEVGAKRKREREEGEEGEEREGTENQLAKRRKSEFFQHSLSPCKTDFSLVLLVIQV